MGYILDSLLGLRHSAGAAVPSVLKNEWSYWSEEEDTVRVTKEKTDGDRWCHGKNINTAIWCVILPSLPLTFLALVALIAGPKWALQAQGHVAGMCWESATWSWRHTLGPGAWLTGSVAVLHNLCHTHTHTHTPCSCDIVCVSSVLWRVRGQMDKSGVKETTFIWNTIFSVWTHVL